MAIHLWSGHAPWSIMEQGDRISLAGAAGPKRIAILGPPGSGKSTMAKYLAAHLGLPVFHLDQVWWLPGWIEAPPETFAAEVTRIAALPEWVIDGNFISTLAPRFQAADMVIYLDIPAWLSLLRVTRRMIRGYGRVRPDMRQGCPEKLDLPFLWFTARWNRVRRIRNLGLVEGFHGPAVVLHGGRAIRRFMRQVSAQDAEREPNF